jgi:hypothetical protein
MELPKTCKTEFPDPDDLLNFKLKIYPDEGFYKHGQGREIWRLLFSQQILTKNLCNKLLSVALYASHFLVVSVCI